MNYEELYTIDWDTIEYFGKLDDYTTEFAVTAYDEYGNEIDLFGQYCCEEHIITGE